MPASLQSVALLANLPEEHGTRVCIGETPILLVRQGDKVRAFSADCPHAGAPLEKGAVCNGRIVCPWHKGTFAIEDGALIEPPALVGLKRYPVEVKDGHVFASAEALRESSREPSADTRTFAIVGSGAAGAAAVAALRETGFDGRIVLIGEEPGDPYDRTALSKFVLAGDMPPDEISPLLPENFTSTLRVERLDKTVTGLDAKSVQIHFADGKSLAYDAALVCTGGKPVPSDVPGSDLKGVHLLRNRNDVKAVLSSIQNARRVVIVGASFIGLEAASSLAKRKIDVTVVAPGKVALASQFGEKLGGMFQRLHEANGVTFRMQSKVAAFRGDSGVEAVQLESGDSIETDAVILGTGVQPATAFLTGIKLADDGGIPVDAFMRAAPNLYAAGDIAQFPLPRSDETLRIEHWRVAQQQARIAAINMAGGEEPYSGVPYFWTYHFEKRLEYLGHASEHDDVVVDGDLDAQEFIAYLLKDGIVAAVVACEREAPTARLAEAMRKTLTLDQAREVAK